MIKFVIFIDSLVQGIMQSFLNKTGIDPDRLFMRLIRLATMITVCQLFLRSDEPVFMKFVYFTASILMIVCAVICKTIPTERFIERVVILFSYAVSLFVSWFQYQDRVTPYSVASAVNGGIFCICFYLIGCAKPPSRKKRLVKEKSYV